MRGAGMSSFFDKACMHCLAGWEGSVLFLIGVSFLLFLFEVWRNGILVFSFSFS